MEEERKVKEQEDRMNLERSKMLQNKDLTEDKLKQNEELANLRADTAIEKSLISADVKLASDKAKAKDVRILKGPKSQYIELIGDKYEKRKTQQFNVS